MAGDAMRRVRCGGGVEIAVWSSGQGPALLLVHGTTADRWDTVLPELGAHFRVYTMDRRGRGESGDAEPYRVEAEFDDVAAVVDSIGGDVSVLGHSYGALCSLEAARRTSGITKLVLYEPPLGGALAPDESWLVKAQQEIDRGERDAVLVSFFTEVVGAPADQLSTLRELPGWQARLKAVHTIPREFRAAVAYQLDPSAVSEVKIPVLLLRGGDTDWSDVPTAQLEAALPHAHTTVMPGQQHVAMDTGKPHFLPRRVRVFSTSRADQEQDLGVDLVARHLVADPETGRRRPAGDSAGRVPRSMTASEPASIFQDACGLGGHHPVVGHSSRGPPYRALSL
jgi:pimeloyl-ACP methyl ester carboxylesterase